MKLFKQLNCKFKTNKSLSDFYSNLSKDALEKRKTTYFTIYLVSITLWVSGLIIYTLAGLMDPPMLALYSGTTIAILTLLWADYRSKIKLINDTLKSK